MGVCQCCNSNEIELFANIDGYDYYNCRNCDLIFLDNDVIEKIDKGFNIVSYNADDDYWKNELCAAKERSYKDALARMSELFYYSRIKINKFIDIGTGPGYFLDAVSIYLPDNKKMFYGIEKYPPKRKFRTNSKNYVIGDINDLKDKFEAGMCIEVIEHLTPKMLDNLLLGLSKISMIIRFFCLIRECQNMLKMKI